MTTKNIIVIVGVVVVTGVVVWLLGTGAIPSPRTTGVPSEGIVTEQGVAVAPGASPVSESGQVVTQSGAPVKLNVEPGSPDAPQQSHPLTEAPADSIKIQISASGISPTNFEVRASQVVTLSVTSVDTETHIFKFKNPSLSAAAVGVGPGETRAITFNAPSSGSYDFFCDVPGHEGRGERGTMTVR